MNKKKFFSFFLIILIVCTSIWLKIHKKSQVTAVPLATWVKASAVTLSSLPMHSASTGSIVAPTVHITAELPGLVEKIQFTDGSFVKADTVLIQLKDAIYQSQLLSAKAKLLFSINNFSRLRQLAKRGIISQQAIDQAELDLKEKEASVHESQVTLDKMQLKAPFSGFVDQSKVSVGDYLSSGQPVVTLTDIEHLRVEYHLPEKYLPLVKLGQKVSLFSIAYPQQTFTGIVTYISPTINAANRSISLYAAVPNERHLLTSGMFVTVKQSLETQQKVILIPAKSLVPTLQGEQVFKIIEGKAYAVNVNVGERANEYVQILQGLHPKDRIITDGQQKVKNGMPIKFKI